MEDPVVLDIMLQLARLDKEEDVEPSIARDLRWAFYRIIADRQRLQKELKKETQS